MHFAERLFFWNTFLHLSQFLLNTAFGYYDHVYGIAVGWVLTSVLLAFFYFLEDRISHYVSSFAFISYSIVLVYNLVSDLHWHVFGTPFSYARLVEGAPFVYEYLTVSSVLTGVADGYSYLVFALSFLALLGPFIRLPRKFPLRFHRLYWRYAGIVGVGCASVLFVLSPTGRRDSLWGFMNQAFLVTNADFQQRAVHQPLRLFLPENNFEPAPLLELPPDRPRPNILVINLESVGASYISSYDMRPDVRMEHFDQLASTGILGMRHYSVLGGSSHGNDWALLTGLYAPSFGPTPFSGDRSILQKNLLSYGKQAGYRTGSFVTDFTAYREYYKLFKHPDCDVFYDAKSSELSLFPGELTVEEKMARLLFREIDSPLDEPFMYFYKTNNGHWPYLSRQGDESMSPLDRYKLALGENDMVLGEIVAGLKERGLFENTIILVTGDHGESFQEHENLSMHSGGVYEELVHVRFVISYPEYIAEPIVIGQITSHLDILPTLLDLAGLGTEEFDELEGYSLIRTLPPNRMIFTVNGDDGTVNGVIQNEYKFIRKYSTDTEMLYDLSKDPLEEINIVQFQPAIADSLREYEKTWVAHRQQPWGRSRYMNPESLVESDVAIVGNVDVDVFLNGDRLATLSDAKNLSLPVQFKEGHNFVAITGFVRSRGTNTSLRVLVRSMGTQIDTGPGWQISSSPEYVLSRAWLDQTTEPDEWASPVVIHKRVPDYIEFRDENWIELDRRKPFVLRLDFEVADGRLVANELPRWLNINANSRFQLFIDGMPAGSGADDTYRFAFPRLDGERPEILVAAYDDGGRFGLLTAGRLGGYDLKSTPENWESLGNMTYEEWTGLSDDQKRSSRWTRPQINESYQVDGDWGQDAKRLWAPNQESGSVLFRYVYE